MPLLPDEVRIVIPRWWQPALMATATLLAADTARYLRRDDWIAPHAEGAEGLVLGLVLYLVCTGIPAFLLYAVTRNRASVNLATYASAAGAALGACALVGVAALAQGMRAPLYGLVAVGVAATPLAWAVLTARTARPGLLTAAFVGALAAGTVALSAFQHLFLFDAARFANALAAATIYAALTFAATLLAGRGWAVGRASAVALVLTLCGAFPAAIGRFDPREADADFQGAVDTRPNLTLIVADALRADYLSVYGGPVITPWLDRLAARGAVFEHAYALAPWTLPSMTMLAASQFPAGLAASEEFDAGPTYQVPPGHTTLAERLLREGYDTAAFVGSPDLGPQTGVLRGFETVLSSAQHWRDTSTRAGLFARLPLMHDALSLLVPAWAPYRRIDTTGILTGFAQAWLLQRERARPFFLFVHYPDPAAPYTPPLLYRLSSAGWPYDAHPPLANDSGQALAPDQLAYVAAYAGEVRYLDAAASGLLEVVPPTVAHNTFVVFTATHGEEFWDHGAAGHGHTLHEEVIRVPLVVTGPGIAPQRFSEPISHLDVTPTMAGLVETDAEPAWQGENRAPWLRGEDEPAYLPPVFALGTTSRSAHGPLAAIIDWPYKRVRSLHSADGWLYDLSRDPAERDDRTDSEPDIVHALDQWLDKWQAGVSGNMDPGNPESIP